MAGGKRLSQQKGDRIMSMDTVPLTVLAAELSVPVDNLAARLAAEVVRELASGIRVVPAPVARALIDEQADRRARAAQRAEEQRRAKPPNPVQQRVRTLKRRAEELHRSGDSTMSAFEMMAAADTQAHLDGAPSRRMDGWLRGESTGYRFTSTSTE
jgi:hypothetical protein